MILNIKEERQRRQDSHHYSTYWFFSLPLHHLWKESHTVFFTRAIHKVQHDITGYLFSSARRQASRIKAWKWRCMACVFMRPSVCGCRCVCLWVWASGWVVGSVCVCAGWMRACVFVRVGGWVSWLCVCLWMDLYIWGQPVNMHLVESQNKPLSSTIAGDRQYSWTSDTTKQAYLSGSTLSTL